MVCKSKDRTCSVFLKATYTCRPSTTVRWAGHGVPSTLQLCSTSPRLLTLQTRCVWSVMSPWQTTNRSPLTRTAWFGFSKSASSLIRRRRLPPAEYSSRSLDERLVTRTSPTWVADMDQARSRTSHFVHFPLSTWHACKVSSSSTTYNVPTPAAVNKNNRKLDQQLKSLIFLFFKWTLSYVWVRTSAITYEKSCETDGTVECDWSTYRNDFLLMSECVILDLETFPCSSYTVELSTEVTWGHWRRQCSIDRVYNYISIL